MLKNAVKSDARCACCIWNIIAIGYAAAVAVSLVALYMPASWVPYGLLVLSFSPLLIGYMDADETVVRVDASWHGGWNQMLDANGDVPMQDGTVTLYSEPGKHAFAAMPAPLLERRPITEAGTGQHAGKMGVHVTPLFDGVIHARTPVNNRVVQTYLQRQRFVPAYEFTRQFSLERAAFVTWETLRDWIPSRVHEWVAHLKRQIPYNEQHVLRISHRGASAHAQEGSADAVRKAAELGADMIEMDIRFTADHNPRRVPRQPLKTHLPC